MGAALGGLTQLPQEEEHVVLRLTDSFAINVKHLYLGWGVLACVLAFFFLELVFFWLLGATGFICLVHSIIREVTKRHKFSYLH